MSAVINTEIGSVRLPRQYQTPFNVDVGPRNRTSPLVALTLGVALGGGIIGFTAFPVATTGEISGHFSTKKAFVVSAAGVLHEAQAVPYTDAPDWRGDLLWIKAEADVTVSALSGFFGVTRKAFYGWLDGVTPKRGGSQMRIAILREMLGNFPTSVSRATLFALADVEVDGETLRSAFQGPAEDEDEFRERLNAMVAKLAPALEQAERRGAQGTSYSRAYESDFSAI